jgi:hypothetical protein
MKLRLSYDRAVDAWVLSHEEVHIASDEDMASWRTQLLSLPSRWAGRREYLLIDVRGFHVEPAFGPAYARSHARWSPSTPLASSPTD